MGRRKQAAGTQRKRDSQSVPSMRRMRERQISGTELIESGSEQRDQNMQSLTVRASHTHAIMPPPGADMDLQTAGPGADEGDSSEVAKFGDMEQAFWDFVPSYPAPSLLPTAGPSMLPLRRVPRNSRLAMLLFEATIAIVAVLVGFELWVMLTH